MTMVFACYFAKGVSFAVKKKIIIENSVFVRHPSLFYAICFIISGLHKSYPSLIRH